MGAVYGIGAAIVMVGAYFKLTHIPGADIMLALGLGVEALIFFLSAFEPQHLDYAWDNVFVELDECHYFLFIRFIVCHIFVFRAAVPRLKCFILLKFQLSKSLLFIRSVF